MLSSAMFSLRIRDLINTSLLIPKCFALLKALAYISIRSHFKDLVISPGLHSAKLYFRKK